MTVALARGLKDVMLDTTESSFIDGELGILLYRGYSIHDLASKSSFEEVSYLLLHGKLPTRAELAAARGTAPAASGAVDLTDGIDLHEARWIAMCFHPDCRRARADVRTATAELEHAGTLPDPELSLDAARILASVPHRWLAAAALDFTVPWNGRLGLQRRLAATRRVGRELLAMSVERSAANAADAAWARWSVATARVDALADVCARLRDLAGIAQRLEQGGSLTHAAARAFTLELTTREIELAAADDAVASGDLELRERLGLHPEAPVTFVPAIVIPAWVDDRGERTRRLPTSPAVLPARRALAVAENQLELEVRRQWPDLRLAPGWQEEDAQPRAALGLSLPLPLFAGNDAAIAAATAERAAAAEALRAAMEQATHRLAAAELHWQQATRHHRLVTERLVPLAQAQLEDGKRLAELGQLEPLLLLDALARVHDARMQQLDAALAEAIAVVAVNEVTGLDFSEGITP